MDGSMQKMLLSCVVVSSLISIATSAGNEYLPPSKGYNYERPVIPFPSPKPQPTVTPRPQPPRPYLPPVTTSPPFGPQPGPRPTPGPRPKPSPRPQPTPHDVDHHHNHHEHHEHHDGEHDHHHHHEPGMPFDFTYAVNEDGNDYSHNAISDGDVTRGEYRVALPDGRVQIVKYTADWKNGYNADVSYEGEARYPEPSINSIGSPNQGGQAYVPPSQGGGYKY